MNKIVSLSLVVLFFSGCIIYKKIPSEDQSHVNRQQSIRGSFSSSNDEFDRQLAAHKGENPIEYCGNSSDICIENVRLFNSYINHVHSMHMHNMYNLDTHDFIVGYRGMLKGKYCDTCNGLENMFSSHNNIFHERK